jgi:signal peptidase I
MNNKIDKLEKKLDKLISESSEDKITKANKWKPRKLVQLNKKVKKKPEYILVQYLRNNHRMDFKICKVISGDIIVIENKGHKVNPRMIWVHGKYFWYIIGEWDKEPIGPKYLEKIKKIQRSTESHPILMKMVLGAVEKKESLNNKKQIGWIIGIAAVGLIGWMIFGGA